MTEKTKTTLYDRTYINGIWKHCTNIDNHFKDIPASDKKKAEELISEIMAYYKSFNEACDKGNNHRENQNAEHIVLLANKLSKIISFLPAEILDNIPILSAKEVKKVKRAVYSGTFTERVQQAIEDEPEYKKVGDSEATILCINPSHSDKNNGSFTISLEKDGLPCHCFACKFSGNIKDLANHFGITMTGRDWLEAKLEDYSMETDRRVNAIISDSTYNFNGEKFNSLLIYNTQHLFYDNEGRKQTRFVSGSSAEGSEIFFGGTKDLETCYVVEGLSSAFPYIECGFNVYVSWAKGNLLKCYNKVVAEDKFKSVVASLDLDEDYKEQIKKFPKSVIFLGGNKGNDAWDYYNDEGELEFLKVLENPLINAKVDKPRANSGDWVANFIEKAVLLVGLNGSTILFKDGDHSILSKAVAPVAMKLQEKLGSLYVTKAELSSGGEYKSWFKCIVDEDKSFDSNEDGKASVKLSNLEFFRVDFNKFVSYKADSLFIRFLTERAPSSVIVGNYGYNHSISCDYLEIDTKEGGLPYVNKFDRKKFLEVDSRCREGDWSAVRYHLLNLLERNEVYLEFFLNMMAIKFQDPFRNLPLIAGFLDNGGTGKSKLQAVLDYIQGSSCLGNIDNKDKTFLIGKRFVCYNETEAKNKGDFKKITTELKKLAENTVQSEVKFQPPTIIDNFSVPFVFTNESDLFQKEKNANRRLFLVSASKESLYNYLVEKLGKTDALRYLNGVDELTQKKETGDSAYAKEQIGAFLHYLYTRDLNAFEIPKTDIVNELSNEDGEGTFLGVCKEIKALKFNSSSFDVSDVVKALVSSFVKDNGMARDYEVGYDYDVKTEQYTNQVVLHFKPVLFNQLIHGGRKAGNNELKSTKEKIAKAVDDFNDKGSTRLKVKEFVNDTANNKTIPLKVVSITIKLGAK